MKSQMVGNKCKLIIILLRNNKMKRFIHFTNFCLLILFISTTYSQTVDCIRSIDSPLAIAENCTSTSTNLRPINATARVRARRNATWYGDDDWDVTLQRKDGKTYDLGPNCFPAGPSKRAWVAGDFYEYQVKCTVLTYELQQGDILCFDMFLYFSHKDENFFEFLIPIPGYSSEKDVIMAQKRNLKWSKKLNYLKRKIQIQ